MRIHSNENPLQRVEFESECNSMLLTVVTLNRAKNSDLLPRNEPNETLLPTLQNNNHIQTHNKMVIRTQTRPQVRSRFGR